jgi:hypothetical protein
MVKENETVHIYSEHVAVIDHRWLRVLHSHTCMLTLFATFLHRWYGMVSIPSQSRVPCASDHSKYYSSVRGGPGLKILVGLKKLGTIEKEKFILII